jgi:glutamate racemase
MSRSKDNAGRPIAVFDSGMGGVSVLRELVRLMPEEDYLYYGDSANAPYGTRSVDDVRALTMARIGALYDRGIKAAVIACNTATSAAVNLLRERFSDIPVIGMEPAIKPAVLAHPQGRVLVLATPLTLREEKFNLLLAQYAPMAEIVKIPCPELVEFVERGDLESKALRDFLRERLGTYRGKADAAVLGCTHFPHLAPLIERVAAGRARLLDPSAAVARQAQRVLAARGLAAAGGHDARHVFIRTGAPAVT